MFQSPWKIPENATREPSGDDARRERDRSQVRQLLLVGAIVIHGPNLFVAAACADEINAAFGNARQAAAEAENDFVGKAMSDDACVLCRRGFVVLFAEHLRRLLVLDVEQPALHEHPAAVDAQVAERHHARIRAADCSRRQV